MSGTGRILGYWIINSITEGQTRFAAFGVPRRQEFTVNMRKYSDSAERLGLLGTLMNAIGI